MSIGGTAGNMPDRHHYYDLDPTYRNAFGQPLMRLTWNFTENDFKAREFAGQRSSEIAKSMNATIITSPNERRDDFSLIPYQSTHNTGGAIMGTDPSTSVVNKYLQSWDVPNVFVVGASAFPHNSAYNPTGPLGALTYLTADAIKNRYIKRPGHLI
jgi:gluconate 2-dehydrogenase alpha chain